MAWTSVAAAQTITAWTSVANAAFPTSLVTTGGTPIGLLMALTHAETIIITGQPWTSVITATTGGWTSVVTSTNP